MRHLISVARGHAPADLLLVNARIINVFSGEIESASVAISGSSIAGIGDYREASQTIDLQGKYLAPGFINGHTHPESSLLHIAEYARAVACHGTTAIVTDLHEIANVCGLEGTRHVLTLSNSLPLHVFFTVPSCVPASHLETAGAVISADGVEAALQWDQTIGLGEMMNYPGVLNGDSEVLLKLALSSGMVVDGHGPGLSGHHLNAYAAAGIRSDHESTSAEEAAEKLNRGMWVMIREGSSEKNLASLLPIVNERTWHRCFFVVDDRTCVDLLNDGDIDAILRKAIRLGLDPVRAVQMATINPARHFSLQRLGAVAPGYDADLVVLTDIESLRIEMVFHQGKLVARDGSGLFTASAPISGAMRGTVNIKPLSVESLRIPSGRSHQPIIEIIPGQILTRKANVEARIEKDLVVPDPRQDILKLAVVERHTATGNIGLGLVRGFGLRRGALASSVSHDSHNIIVVGADDADMLAALNEVERLQGGLVAAAHGRILSSLPLPIAGLLSDQPLPEVVAALTKIERVAADLGCGLSSPFSALSFLALPVIPELRLTDLGLVDVESFTLIA